MFLAVLGWRAGLSFWWVAIPVAIFPWLVRRHDRVVRGRAAAMRGMAFYERGLARLEDKWVGTGETGERFRDDHHVYANDLDLFGRGSLFELLSLARTRTGEETLARWLTSPADASEIRMRQEAVDELSAALDLRERLALSGADVREAVHTDRLLDWARAPMPRRRELQTSTWLFTAIAVAAIAYFALIGRWWPLASLVLLQAAVFSRLRDQMDAIVSGVDHSGDADFVGDALTHRALDLAVVADLLRNLEGQQFQSSRLALLASRLKADGLPVSQIIRRLQRLSEIRDSAKNLVLFPLILFLGGYFRARSDRGLARATDHAAPRPCCRSLAPAARCAGSGVARDRR